uniref:Uncharacterized protein n=1 Tax=Salix viminalis TaxID=40686 RepID=A0A6N2N7I7_SALVM
MISFHGWIPDPRPSNFVFHATVIYAISSQSLSLLYYSPEELKTKKKYNPFNQLCLIDSGSLPKVQLPVEST